MVIQVNKKVFNKPSTGQQASHEEQSSHGQFLIFMSVFGAIVASIPFYGYWVHPGRDSQSVALWLIACWFTGLIVSVGTLVASIVQPALSEARRFKLTLVTIYLWIALIIGWGGVSNAVGELLAG